ncbi:MAG: RNA-binding transcriptional accessory protein [Clostridia bacterium]|nr:RNA-binding transcriptional accessory protein [Clostridia bacterium]
MDLLKTITAEFNLKEEHATNIVALLDEGNTIPFIARYRKELTGHIDDQVLREFADRLTYLRNLETRKAEVSRIIEEQGKLTEEITEALSKAVTLTEVEDIYRPYKQKKKTRATVAMAKGLTPFAELILAQEVKEGNVSDFAKEYINEELGVNNEKEAIQGALDIIAEWVSDNADLRKKLRNIYMRTGEISSKLLKKEEDEAKVYEMYDDYSEPVSEIKSHRILALNRGEKEGYLRVKVAIDKDFGGRVCMAAYVKAGSIFTSLVEEAAQDGYERLIAPSIEREIRSTLTESANEQAIKMFEVNLRPLLMQPPMRDKVTLGWDPAFRTGCKLAVVDETGKVLDKTVIYPTQPQNKVEEGKAVVRKLIAKHGVQVISIGNGTASKESEIIVADLVKEYSGKVGYMVVSEAGASVYSASKLGAEEFPDYDVSERSAVSIARRLQDPLAELIKIDPKSIGVGQYQHDMPENRLDSVLKGVMEDCVNKVGADLNTASVQLLSYVAGINSSIAKNIVAYREEHGKFKTRKELLKVSKLGEKAFTQCAGFMRIPGAKNILDNTGVHPESYEGTKKLLQLFGYSDDDVKNGNLSDLKNKISTFGVKKVCEFTELGEATLNDIVNELLKPGRDVRDALPKPMLRTDVMDIADLLPGMKIKGTVRNVIDFGAFIDIGVHQDGLVHISEISDRYVRHPSEVLKVGDVVEATVISVDVRKKRIGLSLKSNPALKK